MGSEHETRAIAVLLVALLALFGALGVAGCTTADEGDDTEGAVEETDEAADGDATEGDGAADDGTTDDASGDDADAGADGAALVEAKCTQCHDLGRVESADYDVDGWVGTIERMEANGLTITAGDKTAIAEYLAGR